MTTDRKATEAELRDLSESGALAPNSTFDGVTYRVVPESRGDAPVKQAEKPKSTATKQQAARSATKGADMATDASVGATGTTEAIAKGDVAQAQAQANTKS